MVWLRELRYEITLSTLRLEYKYLYKYGPFHYSLRSCTHSSTLRNYETGCTLLKHTMKFKGSKVLSCRLQNAEALFLYNFSSTFRDLCIFLRNVCFIKPCWKLIWGIQLWMNIFSVKLSLMLNLTSVVDPVHVDPDLNPASEKTAAWIRPKTRLILLTLKKKSHCNVQFRIHNTA